MLLGGGDNDSSLLQTAVNARNGGCGGYKACKPRSYHRRACSRNCFHGVFVLSMKEAIFLCLGGKKEKAFVEIKNECRSCVPNHRESLLPLATTVRVRWDIFFKISNK